MTSKYDLDEEGFVKVKFVSPLNDSLECARYQLRFFEKHRRNPSSKSADPIERQVGMWIEEDNFGMKIKRGCSMCINKSPLYEISGEDEFFCQECVELIAESEKKDIKLVDVTIKKCSAPWLKWP